MFRALIAVVVGSTLLASAGLSWTAEPEALPPLDATAAAKISYRKDVAPILKRHCWSCHNKDEAQGGLNIDTVKLFAQGGKKGPAWQIGKPADSLTIQMLIGAKRPQMPYKQTPLPTAKLQTLRLWILAGAKDDSLPNTATEQVVIPKAYRFAPAVTGLAFSPDGKFLATACRSEVVIVPLEGDAAPQRLPTEADLLTCVAFTTDGQTLASAGGTPGQYGEVRFFQPTDGIFNLKSTRRIGKDTLFHGSFAPDGKTLALGGADGAIHLVPTGEGDPRKIDLHSDWVNDVSFSVDGRLLISCSRDKTVKVTLLETGQLIRSIATSTDYINAVTATPTLVISGGRDRVPATYDLKLSLGDVALTGSGNGMAPTRPAAQYTKRLEAQGGEVLALASDSKRTVLAVAGTATEVRVYEPASGKRLANLTNVPAPVYSVAVSQDGKLVATGSANGQVGIYEATTGKLIKQFVPVPVEK